MISFVQVINKPHIFTKDSATKQCEGSQILFRHQADGDSEELSGAKATSLQDDILALCKLHGFTGTPTLENQLKAVDTEYHQLKEQGQSGKADYVQTLYIWLSKRAGKVLGRRSIPWISCLTHNSETVTQDLPPSLIIL